MKAFCGSHIILVIVLDRLIAELEATEDKSSVKPFLDRIASISRESSPNRRSLLTDSLILDLVIHSNERKAKDKAIASMREIRSELHRLKSKQAKDLEALLTRAIDAEDPSSSKLLHDKGIALIKEKTKAMAGESRRTAILKGLSELGYEVRENMATAWAENGRIVVRKPNEKGYGVELGAVEDAERVQVQLVSFEPSSNASKASQDRLIFFRQFCRMGLISGSGVPDRRLASAKVGAFRFLGDDILAPFLRILDIPTVSLSLYQRPYWADLFLRYA